MERLTALSLRLLKLGAILFAVLLAAGTAVEFAVPKEQLRTLCVQKLQERLRRQVKMSAISIGPWRGLRVEGLAVSEAPDFNAGTFLEAERATVRLKYLPLLTGRVAVDQVLLVEPKVRIVKEGQGRYNFTGLLEAHKKAEEAAGAAAGAPEAQPGAPPPLGSGPGSPPPLGAAPVGGKASAEVKAPKSLDDVINLLTTGWEDPPAKLAQLGALAAAAAAHAATKLAVDLQRVRVRRGRVEYADAAEGVKLSVSGLSVWAEGLTLPSNRVELNLDGRVAGSLREQPVEAEFGLESRMEVNRAAYPVANAGFLLLNKIRHPNFRTERIRAEWDLKGLSPDLAGASGVVRLDGSPGELLNPAFLARQGRWPGLLLYPIQALAKFRGLGLPDLLKIPYNELRGEYSFGAGSLNLAPVYVRGPLVSINAEGVVNLLQQTVGLKASVIAGGASIGVLIKGPFSAPSVEADAAFKGVKPRTVRRKADDGDILDQAFRDPSSLVPDEPKGQPKRPGVRAPRKTGLPRDLDRKHTLKDAENIIDAPLPDN